MKLTLGGICLFQIRDKMLLTYRSICDQNSACILGYYFEILINLKLANKNR